MTKDAASDNPNHICALGGEQVRWEVNNTWLICTGAPGHVYVFQDVCFCVLAVCTGGRVRERRAHIHEMSIMSTHSSIPLLLL